MKGTENSNPANASASTFASNNLLSAASSNCRSDLVVWTAADCGSRGIVGIASDSQDGLCVVLKWFTSSNFSSAESSRYSSVLFSKHLSPIHSARTITTRSSTLSSTLRA